MFSRTLLILTLLLTAVAGCSDAPAQQETVQTVQPVKLFTVGSGSTQSYREFPAVIEAAKVARLAFRVGGEITEFPALPGTDVAKGDLIARLDPTDFQLLVDQAQARYELAQAQYNRTENLVEQGVISPQQFDEVKANLQVSKANLETAKANLRYTELRAPFAGTIAHVFVEAFETVQPQRPIATLQMNHAIDISINVPEQLFARVQRRTDYQPQVLFAAAPGQTFRASLKEWDATADPATNTYKVVFTMPAPTTFNVLPGMSATVRVDPSAVASQPSSGLLVPTSAVFSDTKKQVSAPYQVWVFDPQQQTVHPRTVEVGTVTDAHIEIISGLAEGEQIVVAGVYALREGQRVRPWVKEPGL
ncbi:efflux RND transporter periplasmic adaptor subunit [Pseudidiomarina insulisalsae]|uniref:Efflux RND transporter periplasmic adaptor subunit n=1 Tax=Pseudidiomarina insulisalsae TaxID=575789 RepID=A0A432YNE4_9GAMM|nr:efflux RND transporter periplasmic adaptor subunit [Pseudidiomarina insulisalsae]RUO62511.1 efflux RND transporter periplasmic adaptor subunit [Pseudidiomarina insulisalsae]